MSEKLSEYIGYWVKIQCENYYCCGEIIAIDSNTVVLTNSTINDVITSTKFLGINKTLIHDMDIIKHPSENISEVSRSPESNSYLNVYTSSTQPPVIIRGGSSSAVHRNLSRLDNKSQEKIHKCRNHKFPDNHFRPRITSSGSIPKDHRLYNTPKNDGHKSRNFSDTNFRTRKISAGNLTKKPSWVNYTFNDDTAGFDFDYNLAKFDKNAFYSNSNTKRNASESIGYDSSDSGGIYINCKSTTETPKQRSNSIGIESLHISSHNDEKSFRNFKCEHIYTNKSKENKDVLTELRLMGIIPSATIDQSNDYTTLTRNQETQAFVDHLFTDRSFLQQPDIIQEVTKSQICNSDLQMSDDSAILSINQTSADFQHFHDFWKLDSDCKFPVLTVQQRNKIFECANKFGYDVRTIAKEVGKTISEFVIHQVGGLTRLNSLNVNQIPKIAVILGRCQTSVFAASVANSLLISGCYVTVYVDDSCHKSNEDIAQEIKSLNSTFLKYGRNCDLNILTFDFEDIENKSFDYIITGLESDSNFKAPEEQLIKWCFRQNASILCIDPPNVVHIPWKVAVFVGVPTCSYKNILVRTPYVRENGFFKPRSDGVVGLEIDKMFKKPDGLIVLCDVKLPMAVYSLLNLKYKSPFSSRNWLRLYRENELYFVE